MRSRTARSTGLALVAAGLAIVITRRAKQARRAYEFSGKSVVIAGGSRGLGLVLMRQLAAQGARLTLIARDENELRRAADDIHDRQPSAEVLIVPADVRVREDVERAISKTKTHFWKPLFLVLAVLPHMRNHRRWEDRQHFVDRRPDFRAPPGAVLGEQVRADRAQ